MVTVPVSLVILVVPVMSPVRVVTMATHVVRNASVILMEQRNVTTSMEPAIALTCGLGISVKYHLVSIDSSVCAHDVLSKSSVSHL